MPEGWNRNVRWVLNFVIITSLTSTFWLSRLQTVDCRGIGTSIGTGSILTASICSASPIDNVVVISDIPPQQLWNQQQQQQQRWLNSTKMLQPPIEPARILLGISSVLNDFTERQRRHVIRNTYLDFDRLHYPGRPNRVCALQDYLSSPLPHCQLIYTFLLGPETGIVPDIEYGALLPASMFDNHEQDVLYFNILEKDMSGKRWGWLRMASKWMNDTGIPLVANTDTHLLLLPATFWSKNTLLFSPPWNNIYGGLPTLKKDCPTGKCESLVRETVMRRFVLLSSDLVHYVSLHPAQDILLPSDSPDVAIANMLQTYVHPLHEVELNGLVAKVSQHDQIGDLVSLFDKYKDSLVNYEDPQETALILSQHPELESDRDRLPRLLLGIFSMDSSIELQRREMIRKTYLTAFVDTETPNRICALAELDRLQQKNECQLVYAFIVGGNPGGPKELVDVNDDTTGSLYLTGDAVPTPIRLADHDKGDIVYLNIQENGKEGKSQTYFKFATTVLDRHYLDYLAKTDSDTLIYPKMLLQKVINSMPIFPKNMRSYGGDYRIKPSTHSLNLGPVYMGGHFYFMSPDLARYITSAECNRTALSVYSEDQSIGNFVHSLAEPIRRIRIRTDYFKHPVKRVDRIMTLWNKQRDKG